MYADFRFKEEKTNGQQRTSIVGADIGGTMVASQLIYSDEAELRQVGFVNDEQTKQHLEIYGVKILDYVKDIPELVKGNIIKVCVETGVKSQQIPCLEDLLEGKVSVNEIRNVKNEDLLGREEVRLDKGSHFGESYR